MPFDSWISVDTLWMENCTFLNAGGVAVGRTPNHVSPNFAYFNHNTIVNTTLLPFSFAYQAEMIVTNNVMVNAGMIATFPDFYPFWEDEDKLPRGIINADTVERAWIIDQWSEGGYPYMNADSTADESMRKILVDKNNAWWDPKIVDLQTSGMPAFPDSIDETWQTQMMTMNSRTQAWFDDDAGRPYYYDGDWFAVDPGFTTNEDLMDEWVSFIVTNGSPGAPGGGDGMPWWRTNTTSNIFTPDWPILADLSYSDASLNSGGMGGYPMGDLNWYPAEKASWETTNESDALIAMLKNPALGIDDNKSVKEVSLVNVYPNPASDVLYINSKSELNRVMIYDVIGQMVKNIDLNRSFTSDLDISDLNNGVYILQVETVSGEYSSSKFVKK
jgi:Secretion system C-terminal sorting domain